MSRISYGVFWSAIERLSSQGIQFLLNLIIARLLTPSDYGLIGMLAIFLQISQCLIDGGFANALIRKSNRSDKDLSTVLIFSISSSLILYLILFFSAPRIAAFYNIEELSLITRIIGLNLIINSFSIVQKVIFVIELNFKIQAKSSIWASIVSGIAGIILAYLGYGVWALVVQTLINSSLNTCLILNYSTFKIKYVFDFTTFKELFHFGSKLMFSSLLNTIYANLYGLFIGKKFSARDLGFYSRADQFVTFPSNNFASIISRVSFPVLSGSQHNLDDLNNYYSKFVRMSSFIIFPSMLCLAALSKPLVLVLLTEKWAFTATLLVILCFDNIWAPINNINLTLLQALGRSDLFMKLEIIKKIIGTIILLLTIPHGLTAICFGRVFYSIIALLINMYYTTKLIKKSYLSQMKDWGDKLLLSFLMYVVISLSISIFENMHYQLMIGTLSGLLSYALISKIFLRKELKFILTFVKSKIL
jgi:O-antigen/teichoic acid export membrane protein